MPININSSIYGKKMSNPLNKYFRQPVIHMELPSNGKYWRPGSLELAATRTVPICAMTAKDEILLRTPDALLNGITIAEIFKSCCSAIKDGWAVPNIDVDALLIGIRIASYGNMLDVDTTCPHCQHSNRHAIDLSDRLSNIKSPNFSGKLTLNQYSIKIKPMPYLAINRENTVAYHEDRLTQTVNNSSLSQEEKIKEMTDIAKRMLESSLISLAHQTELIELEDGSMVNEFNFIKEFYDNIDGDTVRKIRSYIDELYKSVQIPDPSATCESCTKIYSFPIDFDFARFFVQGF